MKNLKELETNLPSHSVKEFLKPDNEYPKVMKVSKSPIKLKNNLKKRILVWCLWKNVVNSSHG